MEREKNTERANFPVYFVQNKQMKRQSTCTHLRDKTLHIQNNYDSSER
jgi:hypothetical protein